MSSRVRQLISSVFGTSSIKSDNFQRVNGSRRLTEAEVNDGSSTSSQLFSGTSDTSAESTAYPYTRPTFLFMDSEQVKQSRDQTKRPAVIPNDINKIPIKAGYAEVINAGKSLNNEDQAVAVRCVISRHINMVPTNPSCNSIERNGANNSEKNSTAAEESKNKLEFTYFGIFDGHGGYGTAVMASQNLHIYLMKHLTKLLDLGMLSKKVHSSYHNITINDLIIGALETTFFEMDDLIYQERHLCPNAGGCTALVSVLLDDKLYVAQAGDSRAVIIRKNDIVCMSQEFTPDTERQRIQQLALDNPSLLQKEFSPSQFSRNIWKKDLGKQVLRRTGYMKGWSPKVITCDDIKPPLICGDGKQACLMGTIRVSRGFGDHDLYVMSSNIHLKPFLSCVPEVRVYDLNDSEMSDNDILLMGSDGFWDFVSNEEAAEYVRKRMFELEQTDDKLVTISKELVLKARGESSSDYAWKRNSKQLGSYDDITVFVIPLGQYMQERSANVTPQTDEVTAL
ncbi:protein phosphatase 1H isoform X1 [Octopus bimaculoides]|uniref:PPM-type phosphatase domain-containing protein n=2 Tax=Octopus bimaculoides TaxID=37653 RepID=A0A0L8I6D1_OCTBM|nr:protein phosphatase 1H isoform X1 [Octopus bimaculoides]|eukprot:XP_014790509.1 PREDICTED: protein phosphatase 1H-like [Octopus bimaculoides]